MLPVAQAVVYRGVLIGPRKCLNHRGRRCNHRQAASGVRTVGGRLFQHQTGHTRETGAVQGDCRSLGVGRPGGHDRPLPPMEQAVVEVW